MTPQKNLPNVNVCLCLGLLLLIGACSEPARSRRLPIATIRVGEKEISVEVARTPEQRSRGLMFRRDLGEDEGMLFVFPRVRPLSFYMKHTYVPLAIAFIRADGVIANVAHMKPLTLTSHRSRVPCLYALEMSEGWFARNSVEAGDTIVIPQGLAGEE